MYHLKPGCDKKLRRLEDDIKIEYEFKSISEFGFKEISRYSSTRLQNFSDVQIFYKSTLSDCRPDVKVTYVLSSMREAYCANKHWT